MMSKAKPRDPEKLAHKLEEEQALEDLVMAINKKGSTKHSVVRAARKCWAMVDSGSTVTIADCAKALGPKFKVRPSAASIAHVSYNDAQGGAIPNRGEIVVEHILDDGTTIPIIVQDGKVKMPIISVKEFVKRGSVVKFKNLGGTVRLPDGRVMVFLEIVGVYLICLNIAEPNDDLDSDDDEMPVCGVCEGDPDSGFGRPGC